MASSLENRVNRTLGRLAPWLLGSLLLYWFLPTWVWHVRRTFDPYTFNDDARILIWPFLREADPRLFPSDPFVPYYLAGLPEGYLALFRLVGRLGGTKATSEVLQYISVLSVATTLAATARRIGGNVAAFLAVALVLGSDAFFDRAGGGLPRSFAFPLVSAGLYALVAVRPRLLAVLTVAGAAFYPVVSALLGIALGLLLVLPSQWRCDECLDRDCDHLRSKIVWPSWRERITWLSVTLLAVVVLVTPMSLRLQPYGAPITPAMLHEFPEAGLGGRLTREQHPPFESFPIVLARHVRGTLVGHGEPIAGFTAAWLHRTDKTRNLVVSLVISAAAIRWLMVARRRPRLLRPWLLLLASLLGHSAACLVAPRLFLPERYVQYGVPPLVVLLVACGFGGALAKVRAECPQRIRDWVTAAMLLALVGTKGSSYVGVEVYVPPRRRALYEEISQLPRHAVVAGWPAGPMENVPYLSKRRVLTNFQLEMPFHRGFTLQSRARLQALFEAYFATSVRPITRLCSEFDVTHFLIDKTHFTIATPTYYAPHRAELARLVAGTAPTEAWFYRMRHHPSIRHFEGDVDLVDLSQFPELAPACSARQAQ